ncbi:MULTISPECIES: XisH family protein [Spirulina sp. CCY15215]|uniref:XisH family protein n=1 Tax=Spirulina sp. CCY15215 TaxID=2767591 RepID=UPI00195288D6|nr:XisH family protein [Spirulina major]
MPAKDIYHNAVKQSLIKEGWTIFADPYRISYEDADLYADLAASRPLAAERQGIKIIVEIKSFVGRSPLYDFHNALGQYIFYRDLLSATAPSLQLYLAIDRTSHERIFFRPSVQLAIDRNAVKFFVINSQQEVIILWNPEINM